MLPHSTSNLSSHVTNNNSIPKPPHTWESLQNSERLTTATHHTSSTQLEYAASFSTCTNTSGRTNCLVPRELGQTYQRPLGAVHSQRVSDTAQVLARQTLVHDPCQRGTAIHPAGGGGQTEREGGSPLSAAVISSHSLLSSKVGEDGD